MKAIGLLYLILLYIACFVFVHLVKLARIGLKSLREQPPEPKPEEPPESKQPQPVYYIVEKKRAKSRTTYSQPREIKFTDDK